MLHTTNVRARKSNFELLRIFAMLMIIAHHFASHGVLHVLEGNAAYLTWRNGRPLNKIISCLYAPGGKIGVGIFFMMTGYFMINKHSFSLKKVVLESSFYGLINSIIYIICLRLGVYPIPESKVSAVLIPTILAIFNPATGGVWWFVSAYVMLILLLPFFNRLLNCFTKKGYFIFLVIFWIIWYSIGSLGAPFYNVAIGIFFYCIGGYIRIYEKKTKFRRKIILFSFFIIFWIFDAYCIYANASIASIFLNSSAIKNLFFNQIQTSLCWPICAISMFKLFASINIGFNEIINKIASTTFGIYLIHDFVPFRYLIWNKLLKVDLLYSNRLFPLYALLVVIAVFIVCSGIDMVRQALIEPKMLQISTSLINRFREKYMK